AVRAGGTTPPAVRYRFRRRPRGFGRTRTHHARTHTAWRCRHGRRSGAHAGIGTRPPHTGGTERPGHGAALLSPGPRNRGVHGLRSADTIRPASDRLTTGRTNRHAKQGASA